MKSEKPLSYKLITYSADDHSFKGFIIIKERDFISDTTDFIEENCSIDSERVYKIYPSLSPGMVYKNFRQPK